MPTYPSLYIPHPSRVLLNLLRSGRARTLEGASFEPILNGYGLELQGNPTGVRQGNRSQTVILPTSGGKKVLRTYKPSLSASTIELEHAVLEHLADRNFSSPRLTKAPSGNTLLRLGELRHVLFDFIPGGRHYYHYMLLPSQERRCIRACGELLGELHAQLDDFSGGGYNPDGFTAFDQGRERDIDWLLAKIPSCVEATRRDRLHEKNRDIAALLAATPELEDQVRALHDAIDCAKLPRRIVHADFGPFNILFWKEQPPVVLDFEMVRRDWRLVDLVRSFYRFCCAGSGFDLRAMTCLLGGYESRVDLTREESANIPNVWRFLAARDQILNWETFCRSRTAKSRKALRAATFQWDWVGTHDSALRERFGWRQAVPA